MLLGFDIGGTKCTVVIGKKNNREELEIIDKIILPTNKPVFEMIESLFVAAEKMLETHALSTVSIEGIGICCGGPLNSNSGVILSPPNLPGWDAIPIVDMAEKRFGKKPILQNDANACAIAEWKYGACKGFNNIIFLTFGTGMGAGLILSGKLYSGTSDLAGEVGHIRLSDSGPLGFGKEGSFEGFCSGGGIAQLAKIAAREKLMRNEPVSYCISIDELKSITAKSVAEAAYDGDETAIEIYKTSGTYLGKGISMLIDILNPEMIIIGSTYCRAQSLIEPYMNEIIKKEALTESFNKCKILPAALAENIGDIAVLSLADMCSN